MYSSYHSSGTARLAAGLPLVELALAVCRAAGTAASLAVRTADWDRADRRAVDHRVAAHKAADRRDCRLGKAVCSDPDG